MKIIVKTANHKEEIPVTEALICDRLRNLVFTENFFTFDKNVIYFEKSSNTEYHNKLITLILLWMNQNYLKYKCSIGFGYDGKGGKIHLGTSHKEFYKFLTSFNSLNEVQIEIFL
jgi:hypothetical protein